MLRGIMRRVVKFWPAFGLHRVDQYAWGWLAEFHCGCTLWVGRQPVTDLERQYLSGKTLREYCHAHRYWRLEEV